MILTAVSWIEPRSAVSYDNLGMQVSVVIPVAGLNYTFPVMTALLDVRGLHSFVKEKIFLGDTYSTDLTKSLVEQLTLNDSAVYFMEMPQQDAVSISEAFAKICDFQRVFNENLSLADSATLALSKWFTENISISDTAALAYAKPLTEGVSFQETLFKKAILQGVTETVDVSDATELSLSVLYTDLLNISDLVFLNQSMPFTENVTFRESVFSKTTGKVLSETVSVSDTFTLLTNDYCGLSYFAEDYVGASRIV